MKKKINLACGNIFVASDEWINLDYSPADPEVQRVDLLERLPIDSGSAAAVYSSHFIEHIPYDHVPLFLTECLRVLEPNGILRLVLPDFESMCRTYLALRDNSEHQKANFLVVEMIDQCVRKEPGGQLGRLYQNFRKNSLEESDMIAFVLDRTGEDLVKSPPPRTKNQSIVRVYQRIYSRLLRAWIQLCLCGLPAAFRTQNVSLAAVGERHHWLWDFHQLKDVLLKTGFIKITRCDSKTSAIKDFPLMPLDINHNGQARKGAESMYVEAYKPD